MSIEVALSCKNCEPGEPIRVARYDIEIREGRVVVECLGCDHVLFDIGGVTTTPLGVVLTIKNLGEGNGQ